MRRIRLALDLLPNLTEMLVRVQLGQGRAAQFRASGGVTVLAMSGSTGNEQDLYAILGVPNSATEAEIAAAYYTLARKYHPDTGDADAESLAKFKSISRAYQVLSDRVSRRDYDRRQASRATPRPFGRPGRNAIVPLAPAAAVGPVDRNAATGSADVHVELPVTPEEAYHGGLCDFILRVQRQCDRCAGTGWTTGHHCRACGGRGDLAERTRIQVRLPRGLRTGSVIRVAGHGGRPSGHSADLWLHIRVRPSW
jgi:molecular chaperone DnaJ